MEKLPFLLIIIIALISTGSGFQIDSAKDSLGNQFNFKSENSGDTITYGDGTARYGRVPFNIEIENKTDFQVCVRSEQGIRYNYRMGGSDSHHPQNTGFENTTTENCHSWQINSGYVENGRFQINIWTRDNDSEYSHSQSSRSDSFLQLRYENVTFKPEQTDESEPGIFQGMINFLRDLFL